MSCEHDLKSCETYAGHVTCLTYLPDLDVVVAGTSCSSLSLFSASEATALDTLLEGHPGSHQGIAALTGCASSVRSARLLELLIKQQWPRLILSSDAAQSLSHSLPLQVSCCEYACAEAVADNNTGTNTIVHLVAVKSRRVCRLSVRLRLRWPFGPCQSSLSSALRA